MTEKHRKILAVISIIIFFVFSFAVAWFIGKPLIKFVRDPSLFREWVNGKGIFGKLAFIGMTVLQIFIAIIPGEPLEIGAGYAFGAVEGTVLCIIGVVIGSLFVFLFVRKFGVKAVEVFFPREKIDSLKFLKNSKQVNLIAFILFFIPGTPKDILSYCVGLTNMKLSTFLIISATARIPSIITSTIGGNALGKGRHIFAIVVFAITVLISIAGIISYKLICRHHEKKEHKN